MCTYNTINQLTSADSKITKMTGSSRAGVILRNALYTLLTVDNYSTPRHLQLQPDVLHVSPASLPSATTAAAGNYRLYLIVIMLP